MKQNQNYISTRVVHFNFDCKHLENRYYIRILNVSEISREIPRFIR